MLVLAGAILPGGASVVGCGGLAFADVEAVAGNLDTDTSAASSMEVNPALFGSLLEMDPGRAGAAAALGLTTRGRFASVSLPDFAAP